ncbi:homeobox-domain-containing protein [Trametes cingulata]|nr:homeobox-domain-containing protein [Trametes cingulata]
MQQPMHPSLADWHQPQPLAASSKQHPSKDNKADQQKKPRHRHSASQLAALNELYDKNEHPSLEERTALAQRLGMETKTVNSWFQNKRASSKKRHKAPLSQCELPPISALIASVSAPPPTLEHQPHHPLDYDDYSDDESYHPLSHQLGAGALPPQQHTLFYAGNPQHKHLFETEGSMPRKARSRPTAAQTEELKKLYELKPHPTKEEREALGDKIGMRYQSVTNWFQNQRSIAKKREEAAAAKAASLEPVSRGFTPALLPPTSGAAHPSLAVPPATSHPSLSALLHPPRARRSPSAAPSSSSRPSSPRASPYHTPTDRTYDATHRRPRRTRPEPYQLEALKKLFKRTRTPSIEDRQMLAAEIGMDVNKVTNWFRNLRQSDRKRARQHGSASAEEGELDDDESGMDLDDDRTHSSMSRTATPGVASSSSSSSVEYVKIETEEKHFPPHHHHHHLPQHPHSRGPYARSALARSHSDMGSDEDTLQEAVTPSPESSPPPSAVASTSSLALPLPHPHAREAKASLERYPLEYAQYGAEKLMPPPMPMSMPMPMPALETGVKMEDALLLLSFHHSTVVH